VAGGPGRGEFVYFFLLLLVGVFLVHLVFFNHSFLECSVVRWVGKRKADGFWVIGRE